MSARAKLQNRGKVFLVGAGPGAPDLITIRGADVLSRADVVIYDHLVSPELIRLAPPKAELIYAGKQGGAGKGIEQSELNAMLIERARMGRVVIRLKGGDPFIFGRGGEEAQALARANVRFEVIPGVTSAIAGPAFAGIPLTHREHGSFVAFVTGHEDESKGAGSTVPWEELVAAARRGGTIVILMATARMRATLDRIRAAGLPAKTPAVAVQWATTAAQKTVSATLATLADASARAGIGAPAVIVVGECAGLREHLKWVERTPLFGRTVVVTRSRETASQFATALRRLGAEVVEFPTIETAPLASYAVLDRAIARLSPTSRNSFDWIIFTSATGVESFVERLKSRGRDIRELGRASIAAIGPATAARLADYARRGGSRRVSRGANYPRHWNQAHSRQALPDSAGRSCARGVARNSARQRRRRSRSRARLSNRQAQGRADRADARADRVGGDRSCDVYQFQYGHKFLRLDRRLGEGSQSRGDRADNRGDRGRAWIRGGRQAGQIHDCGSDRGDCPVFRAGVTAGLSPEPSIKAARRWRARTLPTA